jgi:hypothetical protein
MHRIRFGTTFTAEFALSNTAIIRFIPQDWFPSLALHFIDMKWEAFYDAVVGGRL